TRSRGACSTARPSRADGRASATTWCAAATGWCSARTSSCTCWLGGDAMIRRLGALLLVTALVGAMRAAPDCPAPVQGTEEITPRLVAAVDRGLEFLAQAQQKDGSWLGNVGFKLNQEYRVQETMVPHVGVTALSGMAFLAGGHLPDRGKYGRTLDRAITFLLAQVNDQGFVT